MSFGNPFASASYEDDSGVNGLGYNGFEVSLNYISGLPDPNIVSNSSLKLIFKSLLKRDDTTKEKALTELAAYVGNKANVAELKDDLVLITWIQLYPKLSISESKSVRSLAHQVHTLFISNLQKTFAKYLKDSIPVLLTGIYDFDSSVSNSTLKSLQICFNNDQTKINNIWVLFQSQILNFANQVLNKETIDSLSDDRVVARDEAELKYQRLVNSTISIVNHLIQLGLKTNPEKIEKELDSYKDLFTYENLWHYLLVNTNTNNQRIYKTLLSLLNSTLKNKPEIVTDKAWKLISKRLLKSLTFTKKIDSTSQNSMLYSSLVVPILTTLLNLTKINPDFYSYDKSAKERVVGLLKIGSLNSDAIYYKLLESFLNDSPLFDFTSDEDFKAIEKILHDDFTQEVSKNLKFRNGADFILNSLTAYVKIIGKFNDKEQINKSLETVTHEVLQIKSPLTSKLLDTLSSHISSETVQKEIDDSTFGNIENLLALSNKTSTPINKLLSKSLDSLREKSDEESEEISKEPAFVIFEFVIKSNLKEYIKEVDEFIDELPGFINPNFIETPIQILIKYSKSELFKSDVFYEAFDTLVLKLIFPQFHILFIGQIGFIPKQVRAITEYLEIEDHVASLLNKDQSLVSELIPENYDDLIIENYGEAIDSKLSLGNPLQSNIFALNTQEDCFQFENLKPIIKYGQFLNNLAFQFDEKILIQLGIIAEVAIDYDFLIDESQSQFNLNDLLKFQKQALTNTESQILAFYHNRLLKFILSDLFNKQSTTKISELDLDKYVKSGIRDLRPISVLTLTTVLSTLGAILSDPAYERLRNLVGSELIGLRSSEINTAGLMKLIILNNFINVDDVDPEFEPFQVQRFNMIVNEINKWLDSDVSYEPEFVFVRLQLLQMLTNLNNLSFEKSDSFNELTTRVLQDTIGIVSIGEGENILELKYQALKLYLILEKRELLEKDVKEDIQNEILESFVNDKTTKVNQPVYIYSGLLNRILSKISTKQFGNHYEELFSKFQNSTNFELKRPLLSIIEKVIIARQQDLVIEFELSKENDDTPFKISQNLIDNVLRVPDFDEDDLEEEKKLVNYLWNWVLILLNFKDITLKLRSIYINQLQSENEELISKFLNFIALLINSFGDDKEFLSKIEQDHESFINYEFENHIDDLVVEVRLLSIHLYYTILTSIGSLSSSWFNDIKDRNFKNKTEQFTSKFIAPSLIQNKLNDFETKSPKLTKDHENLKNKINRVTNEIKSTYLIDEQYLELVFKIPSNYPLTNIEVLGPQRVGVKENQWKAWLLASQRIISLQNGEVFESLEFFLRNVTFHFKGFEECAICYSILHQDNSLPSKTCPTCKNKFHAGCLYKWFKSSGDHSCPLCRSAINFR
ncbi:unnamed protein product [Wickerhamomyces anomalus]